MAFRATCKIAQPIQPIWQHILHCFSLPSKSHRENSISSIILESPHQVDIKNVVKCYKHFFGYFNALKTHGLSLGKNTEVCCIFVLRHCLTIVSVLIETFMFRVSPKFQVVVKVNPPGSLSTKLTDS